MKPFDPTLCALGEGPLWHPGRQSLFWFDILGKQMFERGRDGLQSWQFDEHCSAAGWIDDQTLLIASETALCRFDIATGRRTPLHPLESDNPVTRSNDGRADPWGGFWIGTMGKKAEPGAGAIYRFYRRELRQIASPISIPNAISFDPERQCAYYTDTVTQRILRHPLNAEDGWPDGEATVFADLRAVRLNPDGAVTDAAGHLWVAAWGASAVVSFNPNGQERRRLTLPARQITCPAFGGPDLRDLLVTSATDGLYAKEVAARPHNGATFRIPDVAKGRAEPRVIL